MSFLRRTLAFADILFLGLWKALCKLINKWTTNLAAKVKTLLKTQNSVLLQKYSTEVCSWCLMIAHSKDIH